jgi:hypothetical protein
MSTNIAEGIQSYPHDRCSTVSDQSDRTVTTRFGVLDPAVSGVDPWGGVDA